MHGKRKTIGVIIFSFALGALIAAILPLWILAILEGILLVAIGWCTFCS